MNEAQVFDWQWREWDEVFQTNSRHHQVSSLPVENTEPRIVYMKEGVSVEEVITAGSLLQLQQGGISIQRRAYVEKEIQQHMAGDVPPPWE